MKKQNSLIISVLLVLLWISVSHSGVIFEDDFNGFTSGWTPSMVGGTPHITGGTPDNPGKNEPAGWTGWLNGLGTDTIAIVTNEGRSNTPALKIGPTPGVGQWGAAGLVKWLGPVGYDEIYIRYFFKYDQNWRWGNGQTMSYVYHKWLRLWQNVSLNDILGNSSQGIQEEINRGYMVFTTNVTQGTHPVWSMTATHNDGNTSSAGANSTMYYYPYTTNPNEGFLENHISGVDSNGYWTSPANGWHSVEIHVKVASPWPADDGVYELWIDGTLQDRYTSNVSSPPRNYNNMPAERLGTGINYIVLHDNGSISKHWAARRYIWIDDFVVSTTRIGHDYNIGSASNPPSTPNPPPSPPTNLR